MEKKKRKPSNRFPDLTGKTYGSLTVVSQAESVKGQRHWNCRCECGTITVVKTADLNSGAKLHCGCKRDLTGQRFDMLTVIEQIGSRENQIYWLCRCDCGTLLEMKTASLNKGTRHSCGCARHPDLTGRRFGSLVVDRFLEVRERQRYWLCRCDCGETREYKSADLLSRGLTDCGCIRENLTGQRFGVLTVIGQNNASSRNSWVCRCDCGKTAVYTTSQLKCNSHSVCTCKRTAVEPGMQFGYLTVLEKAGKKNNRSIWLCRCTCGNETIKTTADLTTGRAKSCGCRKSKDLTGKVFGKLTVVRRAPEKIYVGTSLRVAWECNCECGEMELRATSSLLDEKTRACRKCTAAKNTQHMLTARKNARLTEGDYEAWT